MAYSTPAWRSRRAGEGLESELDRREEKAIKILHSAWHIPELVTAHVQVGPAAAQPVAHMVSDLFSRAAWQCHFETTPQETINRYPHRESIEVSGVNGKLVKAAAAALIQAGLPQVRHTVAARNIDLTSPLDRSTFYKIDVAVGHLLKQARFPRQRRLGSVLAGGSVLVAVVTSVVLNLLTGTLTSVVLWASLLVLTFIGVTIAVMSARET
jgi:hypothetical protein